METQGTRKNGATEQPENKGQNDRPKFSLTDNHSEYKLLEFTNMLPLGDSSQIYRQTREHQNIQSNY